MKAVERAAREFASKILAIPPNEILPDDTIIAGFIAGFDFAMAVKQKRMSRPRKRESMYDYKSPGFNDQHNK